jgi:TonB family protein
MGGAGDLGQKRKTAIESLKANPLDDGKWGKNTGPFSMEGPLKYRKILKMELPPYPRWAEEKGLEASVSIRLWVDPRGKVKENMYLEKTSGYSEIDHVAMEALMNFKFVPIPSDLTQEDEWGVATFRFELKH